MNKELINKIMNKIVENSNEDSSLEDFEPIEIDGTKYTVSEKEELTTEDGGKYQYGGTVFSVGILDEDKGYDIIGEPLFYIEQDFAQCGSYFEYQERIYGEPYIVKQKEIKKTIWVKA